MSEQAKETADQAAEDLKGATGNAAAPSSASLKMALVSAGAAAVLCQMLA